MKPEKATPRPVASTGTPALDSLVDAVADRLLARMNQSREARLFTVDEAAAYLGRSSKAVRCMIERGNLPAVRENDRVHLDRTDLDRWIELRKCKV
jgi:excisionase family DNA binding protein